MKNITNYINEGKFPENVLNAIKFGMKRGYVTYDGVKYGISADNLFSIPVDPDITLEDFQNAVKKLMDDGIKFKYQTSDEWRKEGYKDPLED